MRFKNKQGEMGLALIIVLIGVLVTAVLSAGMLIYQGQALQNKGNNVRTEVVRSLSPPPTIVRIEASDGTTGVLQNFSMFIRSGAGSSYPLDAGAGNIDFSVASIRINTINTSSSLTYNPTSFSRSEFTVNYVVNSTEHLDGYLSRGDLAEIWFQSPHDIESGTKVEVTFRPAGQQAIGEEMKIPEVISRHTHDLFP